MLLNVWRYAVVTVDREPPPMAAMTSDDVEVRPSESGITIEGGVSFLVAARTPHRDTLPTDGDELVIPADVRKPLHEGIEVFVNLLAVQMRSKRQIASPSIYAAVEPADAEAKAWLGAFKCIKREVTQRPIRIWPRVDPHRHLPLLLDRLDGLALLTEALCHEHPTGRLHELMRVFERAFATGPTKVCTDLLPAFLAPATFGFTPDEVRNWLDLRDRSVHADRRPDFAIESETYPVVNRVEQAAYDVLFNKATWRNATTTRREVFHPWLAAGDARGDETVLYKGSEIKVQIRPLDGFGAYPYFPKKYGPEVPDGWIVPEGSALGESARLATGMLSVREDPLASTKDGSETNSSTASEPSSVPAP